VGPKAEKQLLDCDLQYRTKTRHYHLNFSAVGFLWNNEEFKVLWKFRLVDLIFLENRIKPQ
jgi:hypothetical protein